MDINCDALIKLFFDFCNLSLTTFYVNNLLHVVVPGILLNSDSPPTFTSNTAPKIFPVLFYLFDPPPLKIWTNNNLGEKILTKGNEKQEKIQLV